MNINIYLEDNLGKQLSQYAKHTGKPRNTLIREAIKEWVEHHHIKQWSSTIMEFKGEPSLPAFEATRVELLPAKEYLFA